MSPGGVNQPEAGNAARMTRRGILIGLPAFLAACQTTPTLLNINPASTIYGPIPDEPFPVPAVDLAYVNPDYYRAVVPTPTFITGNPGDIVVDTTNKYLYLVQDDGMCRRYGVGVGREGFGWSGRAVIERKAEWPTWTPPAAMVARDASARPWANGMPGGLNNPLGARALYLYQGGNDTLYRIHGTIEPWSIGTAVSSGCVRLINQDIIDLYQRVPTGTRVTVMATA